MKILKINKKYYFFHFYYFIFQLTKSLNLIFSLDGTEKA
jgi:hypothetical protein